jgi:glutamyl-tRNA synthetase
MRNFLALLGWSPGGDREILPEAEMIKLFSLDGIQKKPAVFDLTKLEWMNGEYLSLVPVADLLGPVKHHLDEMRVKYDEKRLPALIDAVKARSRTLLNIANQVATRARDSVEEPDPKAVQFISKLGPPTFHENLRLVHSTLQAIDSSNWDSTTTLTTLKTVAEQHGKKLGDVMQPVRIALTGSTVSEPVNELLHVVGKEVALNKISKFLTLEIPSTGAWNPGSS